MSKYNDKFVILLDDELEVWPDFWPVRKTFDSAAAADQERQFTKAPSLLPRDSFAPPAFHKNKTLLDAVGNRWTGGIYRMRDANGN